jgi:hypothetical protein
MANTQWLLLCQMPYFSQIKRQITVNITVVTIVVIVWLLKAFGLFYYLVGIYV